MGRGSGRKQGRNTPSSSQLKQGDMIRTGIPFKFEGRPYSIVVMGKRSTVYTYKKRHGSQLFKVKDFNEKQAVLTAFHAHIRAREAAREEIRRQKNKEKFS